MKQKYLIINDKKNRQFKIQEFAELNKEKLSLLCEEAYDYKKIKSAISAEKDELISALRTNNLYPPGIYAEKIAAAVIELHQSKDKTSVELFFDDISLLAKNRESVKTTEPPGDDSANIDELLEDNFNDSFEESDELKKIDPSLRIVDDDFVDSDS